MSTGMDHSSNEIPENEREPFEHADAAGNDGPDIKAIDWNTALEEDEEQISVRFRFSVFVVEFLTHQFHPISLPLCLWKQGVTGSINKGFLPGKFTVTAYQSAATVFGWVPLALAISQGTTWSITAALISHAFFLFRNFVIAGKYALYPCEEYKQLSSNPEASVVCRLLLTSWLTLSPRVVERELTESEKYSNIDLSQCQIQLLNGRTANARQYLRSVINSVYSVPNCPHVLRLCALLVSIGLLQLPVFSYLDYWESHGRSVETIDILIVIGTCIALLFLAEIVFTFMTIGLVHYYRKARAQKCLLAACARSRSQISTPNFAARSFSLQNRQNIIVWEEMRTVLRNFGRVYEYRISYNTLCTGFVLLFFVLLLLQQILDSRQDFKLALFVLNVFLPSVVIEIIAIAFASQANYVERCAGELLLYESRCLVSSLQPEGAAECELLRDTLSAHRRWLLQRLEVDPVTVMFLPANSQLISAFIAGSFSGLFIGFQVLTGASSF